jgi:hypothetical protein
LQLGAPNTSNGNTLENVTSIHPLLMNKDRLAYLCRKILHEMGLAPDKKGSGVGDKFVLDMYHWNA